MNFVILSLVAVTFIVGGNVAEAQLRCYNCAHYSGPDVPNTGPDICSPGKFNPGSAQVDDCQNGGECFTASAVDGENIVYIRGCTTSPLYVESPYACGETTDGVTVYCCDGYLCNKDLECYNCAYYNGPDLPNVGPDTCSPGKFNPSSDQVDYCQNGGVCFTASAVGENTVYIRGCDTGPLYADSPYYCGQRDDVTVSCCDENLCNDFGETMIEAELQCYNCYYDGGSDNCSPGEFNPGSAQMVDCRNEGKCFVAYGENGEYARGCTTDPTWAADPPICGDTGEATVSCCGGNLCNGGNLIALSAMLTVLLPFVTLGLFY